MIRGFQPNQPLEPEVPGQLQWVPALSAGLITGLILLVVPRGSPWSSVTFFSPVIMGRALPPGRGLPLASVWLVHLAISVVYGLIISVLVTRLHRWRAILAGGSIGVLLYLVNFGLVSLWWPELRGNEISVVVTHVVFGLIAAGAYRGLLRRKPVSEVRVAAEGD